MFKNNYSDKEAIVLSVIQEYLDQNRQFDHDKIIPYIKNRCLRSSINLNDEGIRVTIQSLINNYYIVQGSKLSKYTVLENANRRRIFGLVKNNPGIYFSKLKKISKLANHVVSWHINVLLKFDCIKSDYIDGHELYFHASINRYDAMKHYFVAKKKSQQILKYFKKNSNEGFSKTRLSKVLKTHYNTISKYIDKLEELKILRKEVLKNSSVYYLIK